MKVFKTSTGKWCAPIQVRVGGKIVHRQITLPTKAETIRRALDVADALRAGKNGSLKSLDECLTIYERDNPGKWDKNIYVQLREWTKETPLVRLSETMRAQLKNYQAKTPRPSPSAYNKRVGLAKIAVRYCFKKNLVDSDYLGDLKKVIEPDREQYITADEFTKIFNLVDPWAQPIVLCAYRIGARGGELRKMKMADVDIINHKLTIRAENCKTGRGRIINMPLEMYSYFEAQSSKEYAFDRNGRFILKDGLTHAFRSACVAAGFPTFQFRDLRATAGTDILHRAGLVAAQRLLGHTKSKTTLIYTRIRSAEELESAINPPEKTCIQTCIQLSRVKAA